MAIDVYGNDDPAREPEGRGWDYSLDILAGIALAGGLTLGGLKYFPSAQRKLARTELGKILGNASKQTKAGIKSLFGGMSKVYSPSPYPAPGWGLHRPTDLTLQHELDVAVSTFRTRSGVSGAGVDEITRSIFNRSTMDVPIAYGQTSALTVGDIMAGVGRNALEGSVGTTAVNDLVSQVTTLSKLPGFRQSLARQGHDPVKFWTQVPVGAFMAKEGKDVYSARGGLRAALEDLSNLRIPFTTIKPLSTLIPDLSPKPGITTLGRSVAGKLWGARDALYARGNVIPLGSTSPTSQTKGLTTGEIQGGYRLEGIKTEGFAKAAAARLGILAPPTGGWGGWFGALPSWAQKVLRFGRSRGISPNWAGRESRFSSIIKDMGAIARGDSFQAVAPPGSQAAGITPEGAFLRSLLKRPTGSVNSAKDLTWFERLVSAVGMPVKRPRLVDGEFKNEVVYGLSSRISNTKRGSGLRSFGRSKITGRQVEYTVGGAKQAAGDYLNWQASRPLWMLSEFAGFNIKPGKNALSTLGQIGLKLALPAYAGYQALEYLEYKSRRITGVGPLTGAAWAYTTARVGAQSVLDKIGVTDTIKSIEEKYPGLVDSPASAGIRAGATALAGVWGARALQSKYGKMAAVAGGAVLGAMQVAGITKSATELSDEYTGKADVPIRSGRWWSLGRQPFGGGKIDRFEPSWYRQLWARPTSVGRYGNMQESWRGSFLPLPENWFLLKNAYDPYYLERSHYYDYPYPATAGMGGDIPLVGSLVEGTVGRLLKPIQRREIPVSSTSSTPGPESVSGRGWGQPGPSGETILTNRLDIMTGDTLHKSFEWTGLPGFFIGALRERVTGKDGWYIDKKALATSRSLASPTKDFYEMQMGGMLGISELYRRFQPRDQNYYKYNPIANRQPTWLPGKRSVFQRDRESLQDFHTGSPLDMIERAEMRLPGPGWDVVHNKTASGMDSALNRYQVLADVAPSSEAYRHYKKMVEGQVEMGVLARSDVKRFVQVQNQVAEQMRSRTSATGERYAADAFRKQEVTIADTGTTTFTTHEHPGMKFHLAGVEDRPYALDGAANDFGRLKRQMAELRGERLSIMYGGYGQTTPAILGDINKEAINMGLGKKPTDDIDYRAKHGSNMFQRSYEWLTQTSLPGPLGYPKTKWFGEVSPIDEYKSFVKSGTWDTGWEQPYQNYLKPWFNQSLGTASSEYLARNRTNEYLDNFKFAKYRRLATQHQMVGDARSAAYYEKQAAQTMVGLDPADPDFFKNVGAALPASERPYFHAFAGVTSERQQEEVLSAVPNSMKQVYMGVWQRQAGTDGFHSPVLQRYAQEAEQRRQVDSAQRVSEYFAHQRLPAGDAASWHPQVDMNTIRVKEAEEQALDAYAMGMGRRARMNAEGYNIDSPTESDQTRMSKDEIYRLLLKNKVRNPSLFMGFPNSDHAFLFRRPNSAGWEGFGQRARMQGNR